MNNQALPDYLQQLHACIGRYIEHRGRRCQLIEILHQGPMLVFRCEPSDKPQIQANQHGNPNRRVADTYSISLLNDAATDLHPLAKECLPDELHQSLLDKLLRA